MATIHSPFVSFFMTDSCASHLLVSAGIYPVINNANFVAARLLAPLVISGMLVFTFLELTALTLLLPIRFVACLIAGRNWSIVGNNLVDIPRSVLRIVFLAACVFGSILAPKTIITGFERTHNAGSAPMSRGRFCSYCRDFAPVDEVRRPNVDLVGRRPVFAVLNTIVRGAYDDVDANACAEGRSSLADRLCFFTQLERVENGQQHAQNLVQFISRLRESQNRPELLELQIEHLLDGISRFPRFKEAALASIADGLTACVDRVGVTLDDIHLLWLIYCNQNTNQDYIDIAVGANRLNRIDEFALERGGGEAVEVALFVRLQTKQSLNLPILSTGMVHRGCGYVTQADWQQLQRQILRDTSSNEARITIASETDFWQKIIRERHDLYFAWVENIDTDIRADEEEGRYLARVARIEEERKRDIIAMVRALTVETMASRPISNDPVAVNAFVRRVLPYRV